MIFAPRSWPSRPGFATTTRIFFSPDVDIAARAIVFTAARPTERLERRRFPVGSEHLLELGDDLALGGLRPGGLEQVGHEVLTFVACRIPERAQRRSSALVVAALAQRRGALDALALDRR